MYWKCCIPVGWGAGDVSAQPLALLPEPLVQQDRPGHVLVVRVHLLTQLVDKLVEAKVHLSLHLVIEELLAEHSERIEGRVVVEVEGVEDALHVRGVLGVEDVVGEDPGHGHLDGELDPLAHGHLQVELAIPQLAQVATVLDNNQVSKFVHDFVAI